jgi:hypothetical protein
MHEAWNKKLNEFSFFDAGYLIVKTYATIYHEHAQRYNSTKDHNWGYDISRIDASPDKCKIQYHGIDRDALNGYRESNILAEIRMDELEETRQCLEGFIFSIDDLNSILSYLENSENYEVIWVRIAGSCAKPPENFISAGFEPTYFGGNHFSALYNCMFLPRCHGTDSEGILFKDYFNQLNEYGLFSSVDLAETFLDFYLSFDWTEHFGEYFITEVFVPIQAQST